MKMLIVDNEKHVIEAVRLLVDWNKHPFSQVEVAFDDDEAVRMIQHIKPEIVLTDMQMPNMHGMKLVEWLHNNAPHTKIIVISGYTDFNYIQHTMRYGGIDYITKPIDQQQLDKALTKAVETIEREQVIKNQNMDYQKVSKLYWEKLIESILEAPHKNEQRLEAFTKHFGISDQSKVQLAQFKINRLTNIISHQFETDMHLLYFAIINICNEISSSLDMLGFTYASKGSIYLLLWKNIDKSNTLLKRLVSAIYHIYQIEVSVGVSEVHLYPEDIGSLIRETREALANRNLLESKQKIHNYNKEYAEPIPFFYMDREEYLRAFKSLNTEKIKLLLDTTFEPYKQLSYISEQMLEMIESEYELNKRYWLKKLAKEEDGFIQLMRKFAQSRTTLEGLASIIYNDTFELVESIRKDGEVIDNMIENIVSYVRQHYDDDISLAKLSEIFFISKEHLSRKFKKEMGQNLSEFITTIRMENARLLVGNPGLTIKIIAMTVGYKDEKYFSKVFRKFYGISPVDYRDC
ncbi:response regulator [Petrocella sp. FN5]|uniref:response regulator n=1 Tax=Petrocella sp. FN5 TaxID=3032002 RepID=UPI0023DAB2F2|nr:response regulator [Petrocella sp. FN5]MDF1617254.1 response regulator [Petrocella sp. FN5]